MRVAEQSNGGSVMMVLMSVGLISVFLFLSVLPWS